jgi:tagatose 6-phosphate kinase
MSKYVLTVALNAAVDVAYTAPGFAVGRIATAVEVHKVAGGKANNVARVLARLGCPVTATGFAGGPAGQFIMEDLARWRVAADFEPVTGETRTCMAIIDPEGRTLTELREKGPILTRSDADRFLTRFDRLLRGAELVAISGSLPPGIPAGFYGELVAAAAAHGVRSILDSSGSALRGALAAQPYLVKPNRDELEEWMGEPVRSRAEVVAAARRLQAMGPSIVAVSLGAEGMILVTPEQVWQAVPPGVEALNTVGSGDSAVAGMAMGVTRDLPLERALGYAVACGTANAVTSGVAEVRPDDVARLVDRVKVDAVVE